MSKASTAGEQPGRFAYEGLDRVIHEKARLSVLTSLAAHPKGLVFGTLKQMCGLTDGNLSRHLQVLEEARLTYRLRDERGVYSDIWAAGLMRRAALAAGRRITGRGSLSNPHQMLDASLDEMCALVAGTGGPSADELASRAEYRAAYTAKDVPALLGPPAPAPPDLAALPPSVGRVMRAIFIGLGHVFGSSQAQHEDRVLYGIAASKGVYEGPARRVSGPSEFGQIAKGDVLVTQSTTEAFNILLPLLGGIVTDNGACFRTPRSSRANMASPESLALARRPGESPMAFLFVWMVMPARSRCSGEKGRSLQQGARDGAVWVEGRGAWRRRAPESPGPARRRAVGRPGRGRRVGRREGA